MSIRVRVRVRVSERVFGIVLYYIGQGRERERQSAREVRDEQSRSLFAQDFRRSLLLHKSCRVKTKDSTARPQHTMHSKLAAIVGPRRAVPLGAFIQISAISKFPSFHNSLTLEQLGGFQLRIARM